jgi:hypothetical protein
MWADLERHRSPLIINSFVTLLQHGWLRCLMRRMRTRHVMHSMRLLPEILGYDPNSQCYFAIV